MISESKLIYHLGRMTGEQKPITADVFLTNYCNNKCGFCVYGRWDHGKARYMSGEVFKVVLHRLKEVGSKAIILTGGGEPCINPDFDKIIETLAYDGLEYGINTNFLQYKDCDPVYLKVSFDAWDEESYKRVRGVNGYNTVRENIILFKERHNKTNVGIQQIGLNADDVKRFYEGNCDLPVDYIVIRPIESTMGEYYKAHPGSEKSVMDTVREIMKTDQRVKLNFKFQHIGHRFISCDAHWAQIAVDENANVIYCCHKPYEVIGSLFDSDIMEKHRKAKTDMSKCDIPCRMTAPNIACNVPKDVNFI